MKQKKEKISTPTMNATVDKIKEKRAMLHWEAFMLVEDAIMKLMDNFENLEKLVSLRWIEREAEFCLVVTSGRGAKEYVAAEPAYVFDKSKLEEIFGSLDQAYDYMSTAVSEVCDANTEYLEKSYIKVLFGVRAAKLLDTIYFD